MKNHKRYCDTHEMNYREYTGGRWRCSKCYSQTQMKSRAKRGGQTYDPQRSRRYMDKSLYGLDEHESDRLRSIDHCQVCDSPDRLVIDHDHISGRVRGILCTPCNLALGWVEDDPQRLRDLALYLEEN